MSLRATLGGAACGLVMMAIIGGGVGMYNLMKSNDQLANFVDTRLTPSGDLTEAGRHYANARAELMLAMQHAPGSSYAAAHDHPIDNHLKSIETDLAEASEHWANYLKVAHVDAGHEALQMRYEQARDAIIRTGIEPAAKALAGGHFDEASRILLGSLNPKFATFAEVAESLLAFQLDGAKAQYTASQNAFSAARTEIVVAVVLAAIILVIAAWLLLGRIRRPLDEAISVFARLATGQTDNAIRTDRNDELGKLLQGLESMQTRFGFDLAEQRRVGDETARILQALDSVTTNVRIADKDGRVIYANAALKETLKRTEAVIRRRFPGFRQRISSAARSGSSTMTRRRHSPGWLRCVKPFAPKSGLVAVSMRSPPARSSMPGERLGSVGEWRDRTDEAAAQQEINALVSAASEGDFTQHIEVVGKDGFFLELARGMNSVMDTASAGLDDIGRVINALARGELTERITADHKGTFGQLRDDINTTVERLREVVLRIKDGADMINVAASRDRHGQLGSLRPHRRAGQLARGNRKFDGATQRHRPAQRRECA